MDSVAKQLIEKVNKLEKEIERLKSRQIRPTNQKYNEYRIEAVKTTLGASAPTATTRAVGASGNVEMPVLSFSKTVSQECFFIIHFQNNADFNQQMQFHLMWIPGGAYSAGNYAWKLDYLIYNELTGVINTGAPTTIAETVTPGDAVTLIETEFDDLIMMGEDDLLMGRFYRDVASDDGNDTGEILFFEINYPVNRDW